VSHYNASYQADHQWTEYPGLMPPQNVYIVFNVRGAPLDAARILILHDVSPQQLIDVSAGLRDNNMIAGFQVDVLLQVLASRYFFVVEIDPLAFAPDYNLLFLGKLAQATRIA
jgi:hypothetical protein